MPDEINLQDLSAEDLLLQMGDDLYDGLREDVEADAYCADAAVAVDTAKKLIAIKRGARPA